jgi:two-component system NtrC family response regulator
MAAVLIIDDDIHICRVLAARFERMGHMPSYCLTLTQGFDMISSGGIDVVFLDINFPEGSGLDIINNINELPDAPEIIVMTGRNDSRAAEFAIKAKVWDYIQKTGSHKQFQLSLERAVLYRRQKQKTSCNHSFKRNNIIGRTGRINACFEAVLKASRTDAPVLITGETGSGKEIFARAVHDNSSRCNNDFIIVDCAALPDHLVESVLFGHSKGSFTGADSDKPGLLALADKGTLFLDEIGELPLELQKKFLRALQDKRVRPVGSRREISSNFRVIAATHRNIPEMMAKEQFRQDLYYRLASIKIEIPPLRERKPDIPLLIEYHLDRKRKLFNEEPRRLSDEFVAGLIQYDWPGNVRELFNAMDHACSEAFGEDTLFEKHLPDYIRLSNIRDKMNLNKSAGHEDLKAYEPLDVTALEFREYIEKMKCRYIMHLMSHTNGDIRLACSLSGLSRGHLYSLLKKYSIKMS